VARDTGVMLQEELRGSRLGQPGQQWVHFGYRDGLSHVAIKGWSEREKNRFSHEPGEFLLGYANDHGVNPWVLASSPLPVREFFRNGSFGVLRQMQQHVDAFEDFVQAHAEARVRTLGSEMEEARAYIKAKLCGRWPNGSRFEGAEWDRPGQTNPLDEFDYAHDPEGLGCPFGSHVRRMNPRSEDTLHARHRPLLRRGMPYGKRGEKPCGLLGLFFCASIEDQFEHLLGHWGEGVPLGSLDGGSAKDPLFGQHADPRAVFEIPGAAEGLRQLKDLRPFVLTRGTVYAFYPGLATLKRIVSQDNVKYFREEDPVEPRV
jgi:deferrochelatase/peroxidase EfeB